MRYVRQVMLCALAVALTTGVGGLTTVVAVAAAGSTSLVADSYVDSSNPGSNFGRSTALRVDGVPTKSAYLRFSVTGVGAVPSAVLALRAQRNSTAGVEVRRVDGNTWTETGITYNNAPPPAGVIGTTGPLVAGRTYYVNVSSVVTADGTYSFALTSTHSTATDFGSKESATPAQLLIPAPASSSPWVVSKDGTEYQAVSQTSGQAFRGTLKSVVEEATHDLQQTGGGTVIFAAGDFDLGSDYFKLEEISNITFAGAGMGLGGTTIHNNNSAAADTEVFNVTGAFGVTVRDMTVSAGGPVRLTSDALDFDNGNNVLVERVEVTGSRGRAIVFDGKNGNWTSQGNVVRGCVITGIPSDGIELLAATDNRVEGCDIANVAGHGIQATKSSTSADQPNKKASDNVITGNRIDQAGQDGVNIISGDRNQVVGNTVTNSSDDTSGRSGIRLTVGDSIPADDNVVRANTATDNQVTKTQKYGLDIASSLVRRAVVENSNDFTGNLIAPIRDVGTGTIYTTQADSEPPSAPTAVTATAVTAGRVDVSWAAATDNVGVVGYTVYRDGAPVGTVGGATLTFSDTTVAAQTTYAYTVDAFDAATNRSAQSTPPATVTTPAPDTKATITPSADSYVTSAVPTGNYGASTSLRVDGSPDVRTLLRFDVPLLAGSVQQAKLRIWANSASSAGIAARSLPSTSWDELTVTYQNAPPMGDVAVGSSGAFSSGAYVDVDVTTLVTESGAVSIGVRTPSSTAISLGSRESAHPPELVVTSG